MTASIVTSPGVVTGPEGLSRKVVANCEALLFQRPDDAIYRGYDTQTERDMSGTDLFISNYQPLTPRGHIAKPRETAIANLASHLYHGLPIDEPLPLPVDVVAAGRRNNPPEGKIPALCAYNPLHYMELPELFMGVHLLDDW
ncbi:unnamed protein product [Cylicocyclus nassatus]|uniref:Uncharacterized protein n=1 Tax=Cylicocyclus nassatus TaxID=53992 RepID=A0AA36DUC2_CYLNA|nr:unnamed protein product [Cylicocyclus nassatus]